MGYVNADGARFGIEGLRLAAALRTPACVILGLIMLACGGNGPTGPRELAARYVLVQHGGGTLPVFDGAEVQRPAGETQGPGVTCSRDLLATDLHFWPSGSVHEVGWQDSTRVTCQNGSPVQFRRFMVRGHTGRLGEAFRVTLYHGKIDPLLYSVVYLRRNRDTLTVYRREDWRNDARTGVDETLLVFVPGS